MTHVFMQKRSLALLGVIIPLLALFIYVAITSGPLAPVSVTVATVEEKTIAPALFGIGSIEARYTYKIGPTFAGRIKRLDVQVGDSVKAKQVIGEMDPVDLDARIRSQDAFLKRTNDQLNEAEARQHLAQTQANRYEPLLVVKAISEETVTIKQHDLQIADAGLNAAREDRVRARSEREALTAQRNNLQLIAPVDGLVVARYDDPGTTIVAGQVVVVVIDPNSLWANIRFDQIHARGLAANLPARMTLRSRPGEFLSGHVFRLEPLADEVTEEILAKVVFNQRSDPLPPIGELVEVTVELPALPAGPVIPNAAIKRVGEKLGVWLVINNHPHFTPITVGDSDLNGQVQVRNGLKIGNRVIVYSEKTLTKRHRLHVVDRLPGVTL